MGMYCKEMVKVGKAENGYIIEVCVPVKPSTKGKEKGGLMPCYPEMEAQFIAADVKTCCAKIAELLPKLDETYTSEKAFSDAFGAAIAEDDGED